MTPETVNLIIGFGGVALLGVVAFMVAWFIGTATQQKQPPPSQGESQSNTQPGSH